MKYFKISRRLFFISVQLLILTSFGAFSPGAYSQDVEIYIDSTEQFIRGFGAANIVDWYGDDLTLDEVDVAYGTGEGTLGFNILRLRISSNPNAWSNGNQVETARKVHEMGGIVWAAPWNPPASMLDPNTDYNRLDPSYYEEYAAHLDSFNTYMSERGVPLYGISIQNEPDYGEEGGWTEWTPDEMVTFLRDYAPSINNRIIAPESFQFRRSYSDPILNDSVASSHTDIIGGHIYGGGTGSYPLAKEKGKEVWMTEHYTTSDRSANIWPDALEVGVEIQQVMKADWNAYIWWQIKRYYSPLHDGVDVQDPGRDYVDRAQSGSVTRRGWVMSQFARFVRPGDYRVKSIGPIGRGVGRVSVTAYKDTAESKIVIVAVNNESSDKEISFNFHGATGSSFARYITNEDDNVVQLEDIETTGNTFTTTLPEYSITTYVSSDYIPVSNEEEFATVPESYQLMQNYPNPFNPSTVIRYQLPVSDKVTLKVFDMLGREVATLVDGRVSAGDHAVRFDASGLSSGVYIYRIEAGNFVSTQKMLLIK